MRRGDFEAAWRISDGVMAERKGKPCWHWPRHLQYIWTGEPLAGKRVLVRCYHGLGDTLQFVRYLPRLQQLGCRVLLWAQPVLVPLLRSARGIDELLPLHDGTPEAEYDAEIELMELPHFFRTTLETIPREVPYLLRDDAPPLRGERGREETGPFRAAQATARPAPRVFEVGLVWSSGDWDGRRSVPLALLQGWRRIPGLCLHALQRGSARVEWRDEFGPDSGSDDPLTVARAMRRLDLVITVDSMPAHLAGALGVPVWTLLHADPDWRWLRERSDSPWYPTMRLFRQPAPGDWPAVVDRVGFELARQIREHAWRSR